MSKPYMTRLTVTPGDAAEDSDWARVDAMTEAEAHAGALADPDNPPATKADLGRLRRVSRVNRDGR